MPQPNRDPAPPAAAPAQATAAREHALVLENRARLTVSGVTRVVSCDEGGAVLKTPLGDLTVGG